MRNRRMNQTKRHQENGAGSVAETTSGATALARGTCQSHLSPVAPFWRLAPGRFVDVPVRPRTRLTIGIQRRLTKPSHARFEADASPTELLFAGIRNRGCLPPRQIIKAMVDHCNPGTASSAASRCSPDERRLLSRQAKRLQVIATNFAGVRPWRGNRLREENGRVCPAPALYEQTSWSGFPGLWFKGSAGYDGFKCNHGKVRIKPRHYGCGRHRPCAQAAAGGRSIVRHPQSFRPTATGHAPQAASDGCRGETK